ncbi:MAG: zinc ribbon domain-containing protein [Anaerolineae bacterium]
MEEEKRIGSEGHPEAGVGKEPAEITETRARLEKLRQERRDLLAEIGEDAVALYASGEITLPGLGMKIVQLGELQECIEQEEARLVAFAEASRLKAGPPAPAGTCPACGAALLAGDRFCPQCGRRVGE